MVRINEFPNPSKNISLSHIRFERNIPPGAKILFGEICEWAKDNHQVPYETKYLASLYQVSPFTIRKWINSLAQHNFIKLSIDISAGSRRTILEISGA